MSNKSDDFLAELKALLEKYNADIGFTCDDGSDTYGITGEGMTIDIDDETIFFAPSDWWITSNDL